MPWKKEAMFLSSSVISDYKDPFFLEPSVFKNGQLCGCFFVLKLIWIDLFLLNLEVVTVHKIFVV